MKRNRAIDATLTLPGITRPVGRPRKPDALTGAQRSKLYRNHLKASRISVARDGKAVVGAALAAKGVEPLDFYQIIDLICGEHR